MLYPLTSDDDDDIWAFFAPVLFIFRERMDYVDVGAVLQQLCLP